MNNDWNVFLQQQNLEHAGVPTDCALCDLPDLGLIRISGEDARDFLQGQLTNDIGLVDEHRGQLSALCDHKGRMFALFTIFQRDEQLYLQLPLERLSAILTRLRMFVLRSKVTLEDATDDLVCIGLLGDCAGDLLGQVPQEVLQQIRQDDVSLLRMPGEPGRVQLIGSVQNIKNRWQKLAAKASVVNSDFWSLQNIQQGIPSVYNSTSETFIPQTLNLQILNAISFTKGCYTGQEVIARMKYLGQTKRRMYIAHFDAAEGPMPGERLFSASSKSAQGAGQIVDVSADPAGGFAALVMIQIATAEANDLQLKDAQGVKMTLTEPPYGFAAG